RDVAQRDAVLPLLLRFKNQRPPPPAGADEPDVELFVGPEDTLVRHGAERDDGSRGGEKGATRLVHGWLRNKERSAARIPQLAAGGAEIPSIAAQAASAQAADCSAAVSRPRQENTTTS